MPGGQAQSIEYLFDVYGAVEELDFDDTFGAHMASERRRYGKHTVSEREIREVLGGSPRFFENTGRQRAPLIMLGPTRADRVLAVPLEPTHRWGVWRPVTAFEANTHHRERYREGMPNGGA